MKTPKQKNNLLDASQIQELEQKLKNLRDCL